MDLAFEAEVRVSLVTEVLKQMPVNRPYLDPARDKVV